MVSMEIVRKALGKKGVEIVLKNNEGSLGSVIASSQDGVVKVGYLGVKPKYRRSGYGSLLMSEVERWTGEKGAKEIRVNINPVPGSEGGVFKILKRHEFKIKGNTGSKKIKGKG